MGSEMCIRDRGMHGQDFGFPGLHYAEKVSGMYVLVMDFLGPCVFQLFADKHFFFSSKTILKLFKSLLGTIKNLHKCGFVHNDIKSDNVCMGTGCNGSVPVLFDFGMASRYINETTGKHIKNSRRGMRGTIQFASLGSLIKRATSRRDDLESLGLSLIHI